MADEAAVLDVLSEDEAYLYAILSDPSGLDQAEFLWVDDSSEDNRFCPHCGTERTGVHLREHAELDESEWEFKYPNTSGCFRAWAFQWPWWRSKDAQSVDQCARSIGKSLSVKVRGCAFPWLFPGQEMVITAPELIHLEPICGLIENQLVSTRALREMLPRGARNAFTHRPFAVNFLNGSRILGRIPQRNGTGVKGIHPIWLELDEAQDFPHAGWIELNETVKRGFAGSQWKVHGVTRGVRDDFYNITQDTPGSKWKVHRFAAMWRPTWTDRERQASVARYGSREDPDYRRNVLGLHGDKTNPIFVLTALMRNVDDQPSSNYNSIEYFKVSIKSEELELFGREITDYLDFPQGHLAYAGKNPEERRQRPKATFWAGMDIGFTVDPSELLVFVEYRENAKAVNSILKLVTRVSMTRMPHREQIQAILHVIDFYRPRAFSMDKAGNGLPLYQEMSEHIDAYRRGDTRMIPEWLRGYDLDEALTTVKGYNFSERLLVDIDKSVEVGPFADTEEVVSKAGMRRNAKEYSTDVLRMLVDATRLRMPWDEDLLKQFQGGTWTSNRSMDAYGRRIFSHGNDHCLDAARMFALGWVQNSIEEWSKPKEREPVFDGFVML
ncbi:terminase large subunit [Caudovirales GX15bay]|nr:terminase large subunit [Caudovirales GX15bay]